VIRYKRIDISVFRRYSWKEIEESKKNEYGRFNYNWDSIV